MVKFKVYARDLICQFLWILGITRPNNYAFDKLTVITFHRVLTKEHREQYPSPNIAVTTDEFDWLCSEFKEHFECGSFTTIYGRWINNEKTDKPFLAITFDDGQMDNYCNAKPILDKHKLKATFYIPVQFINSQINIWHDRLGFAIKACESSEKKYTRLIELTNNFIGGTVLQEQLTTDIIENAKKLSPAKREQLVLEIENLAHSVPPDWARMMSWSNIKTLHSNGHEIASHSMTHALLPQLSSEKLHFEIMKSQNEIRQQLNANITSFCYPNGNVNSNVRQVVIEAGYENAVTTQWGMNERSTDSFTIKRYDMDAFKLVDRNNKLSYKRLHFRLSGLQPGVK